MLQHPTTTSIEMVIGRPTTADAAPNINPGVPEVFYNDIDDDCDPKTRDKDIDGDGFRAQDYGGDDCNDLVSTVNPGAQEVL